eukprot:9405661-Pyramimonas_sp.AAC.1
MMMRRKLKEMRRRRSRRDMRSSRTRLTIGGQSIDEKDEEEPTTPAHPPVTPPHIASFPLHNLP